MSSLYPTPFAIASTTNDATTNNNTTTTTAVRLWRPPPKADNSSSSSSKNNINNALLALRRIHLVTSHCIAFSPEAARMASGSATPDATFASSGPGVVRASGCVCAGCGENLPQSAFSQQEWELAVAAEGKDTTDVKTVAPGGTCMACVADRPKSENLFTAVRGKLIGIAKNLIARGADVNVRGDLPFADGTSAPDIPVIWVAVFIESLDLVSCMLDTGRCDVNAPVPKSGSALNRCVHSQCTTPAKVSILKLLINAGADVNCKDHHGVTPVMIAAQNHDVIALQLLVQAGADVNIPSPTTGARALYICCQDGRADCARILLAGGAAAQLDAPQGEEKATSLHIAAQSGHTEVVRAIVETGKADLEVRRCDGGTALFIAAVGGHAEIVRLLLKAKPKGANPDTVADNSSSPLIVASYLGNAAIVKELLAAGAAKDIRDQSGKNALDWARDQKHAKVAELLEK